MIYVSILMFKYIFKGQDMRKKKKRSNTKAKIVSAAWKLFYEQGYDETTVDEIVEESKTSKGSFYHYFEGKDALLSSLFLLFDEEYESLIPKLPRDGDSIDKLIFLNHKLFLMIENSISIDLLTQLFSSQLITRGERHLLDRDRAYYKLIRKIVSEGQEKSELIDTVSTNEIVKYYALVERGLMYDWCLCNGDYSLAQYSRNYMPVFLEGYRKRS